LCAIAREVTLQPPKRKVNSASIKTIPQSAI
jgi:hypothetical protein